MLMTFANIVSLFAGVLCLVAWYNSLAPIYKEAPLVVTRLPVAVGLVAVIARETRGWLPGWGVGGDVVLFAGTALATSFTLCFLYGWGRRGHLDEVERTRYGSFSPVMYAWTVGLTILLGVTALNAAVWNVTRPFYIHV
jgi:hypothetical protein